MQRYRCGSWPGSGDRSSAIVHVLATLIFICTCGLASAQASDRIALVVGNSAYRNPKAVLVNPGHDATAMADLLRKAGFAVDQQLDTSRVQLSQAISRFGSAIKNQNVKFALFYYAGHGVQLQWRNYLVPVSADIRTAEDVRNQSVDVSELLAYMSQANKRSLLVILDACRDDPFGGVYRPPAKGLSQFDAPAGSLLAYATAPGSVAIDGQGENGLYTSNLLREFAVRGVRVEDAFKRVRVKVRLASKGRQIPWESTSLEDDLYLFPPDRLTQSLEEKDQLLDKEITSWVRVRSSNNIGELADFIDEFPSGSASELAQARLNRVLAEQIKLDASRLDRLAKSNQEAWQRIEVARRDREDLEARQLAAQLAEQAWQDAVKLSAQQAQALKLKTEEELREARARQVEAERAEAERIAMAQREAREIAALALAAQARDREEAINRAQRELVAMTEAARIARDRADAIAQEMRAIEEQRAARERAEQDRNERARVEQARLAQESVQADARWRRELETAGLQALSTAQPATALVLEPTPNHKGYYEFQRAYRTGDTFEFKVIDRFSKAEKQLAMVVTAVDYDADRVEYNKGQFVSDTMGNTISNLLGRFDTPRQFYPAELYVGKKWRTRFRQSRPNGIVYTFEYDLKVVGRESITVPAGTFNAFKIEGRGFNMQLGARLERNIWVAPGISADIAHETLVRLRNSQIEQYERQELVSLRPGAQGSK